MSTFLHQPSTTTMTFVILVVGSAHGLLLPIASISRIKRVQERVQRRVEVKCKCRGNVVSASECNCESEKYRFERNTECKSETLGFVGLYWG